LWFFDFVDLLRDLTARSVWMTCRRFNMSEVKSGPADIGNGLKLPQNAPDPFSDHEPSVVTFWHASPSFDVSNLSNGHDGPRPPHNGKPSVGEASSKPSSPAKDHVHAHGGHGLSHHLPRNLRDYRVQPRRLLLLSFCALVCGGLGAVASWALLHMIALITNISFYQRLSLDHHASPKDSALASTPWVLLVPVVGSFLVGLMARYGTDKIRGHGIPEALESILYKRSKLPLTVAFFKPLSAAIAIGTGNPFGAEGPIIATGAAIGSLFAQQLPLTDGERKTVLVAGAVAGMAATFAVRAACFCPSRALRCVCMRCAGLP
jgi:hypothetical protein